MLAAADSASNHITVRSTVSDNSRSASLGAIAAIASTFYIFPSIIISVPAIVAITAYADANTTRSYLYAHLGE